METVTGVAQTEVNAQCTVGDDGTLAQKSDQAGTAQSITNDIATIKGGSYTNTSTLKSGSTLTLATGSKVKILGRSIPRSARVTVPDANHNLSTVSSTGATILGKRFTLAYPTANRTHTLMAATGFTPDEGETLEIAFPLAFSGPTYTIKIQRDDMGTTEIATFTPDTAVPINTVLWAEFEYVSGVWRLGANAGIWYNSGTFYGVMAGAGA